MHFRYCLDLKTLHTTVYDNYMTVIGSSANNDFSLDSKSQDLGWDLHCHTLYSDGTKSPKELVDEAKNLGLSGVAISDHDTTAGWHDFEEAAKNADFPVIFGSEITAVEGNISVHVLAYNYNPNDECINEMFATTRKRRLERTRKMVDLMSHDFPITWQDVLAQAGQGALTTIGRPHIADALVAAGVFETRSQAFAGPVAPHGPYYIPTPSPSVDEVIKVIKHAGGVSVIAHPADYSRNLVILSDSQIEHYASVGLNGLEVYHRGNSLTQRQRLLELAKDLNLLVTGGSDWHGSGKPNKIGEETTSCNVVSKILNY